MYIKKIIINFKEGLQKTFSIKNDNQNLDFHYCEGYFFVYINDCKIRFDLQQLDSVYIETKSKYGYEKEEYSNTYIEKDDLSNWELKGIAENSNAHDQLIYVDEHDRICKFNKYKCRNLEKKSLVQFVHLMKNVNLYSTDEYHLCRKLYYICKEHNIEFNILQDINIMCQTSSYTFFKLCESVTQFIDAFIDYIVNEGLGYIKRIELANNAIVKFDLNPIYNENIKKYEIKYKIFQEDMEYETRM